MNEDHTEALALYATQLLAPRPRAWRMTGIDPDGFDLAQRRRDARADRFSQTRAIRPESLQASACRLRAAGAGAGSKPR